MWAADRAGPDDYHVIAGPDPGHLLSIVEPQEGTAQPQEGARAGGKLATPSIFQSPLRSLMMDQQEDQVATFDDAAAALDRAHEVEAQITLDHREFPLRPPT